MDCCGGTGGVSVNRDRGRPIVKGSIRQINVGQHDNQQHQKNDADEHHQSGRVDLPLRHGFNLFCQTTEGSVNGQEGQPKDAVTEQLFQWLHMAKPTLPRSRKIFR